MNLTVLRKLAKSNRFQALYRRVKESGFLKLFKNDYDLSKIQDIFLYYLEIYYMLYQDLAEKKPYLTEEVIDNELRTDAYLFMKFKHKSKNDKKREVTTASNVPSVIFKRKN